VSRSVGSSLSRHPDTGGAKGLSQTVDNLRRVQEGREAVTFALRYAQVAADSAREEFKGGFMSMVKRDDTAAIDRSMGEMTPDSIRVLMQDVSSATTREIGNLIADLEALRNRLLVNGTRFERAILDHATLGHSVVRLANIASQSMVDLKNPAPMPGAAAPSTTN
jgi:hypothetical protein